jgi:translation elongation factor EF-1alpha
MEYADIPSLSAVHADMMAYPEDDPQWITILTPEGREWLQKTPRFEWYQIYNFASPSALAKK